MTESKLHLYDIAVVVSEFLRCLPHTTALLDTEYTPERVSNCDSRCMFQQDRHGQFHWATMNLPDSSILHRISLSAMLNQSWGMPYQKHMNGSQLKHPARIWSCMFLEGRQLEMMLHWDSSNQGGMSYSPVELQLE